MASISLRRFSATLLLLIISVTGAGAYAAAPRTTASNAQTAVAAASISPTTDPLLADQVASDQYNQQAVGDMWNRTELFFGSEKPDGSEVTDRQFRVFVDEYVTPRFPDGLTLLTGFGQFRDSSNVIVKERSRVLILLYPLDDHDAEREIEEIRTAFTQQFQQESVLRVDEITRVSF